MTENSLSPAIIGLNEFDSWCIDAVKPVSYFSPLLNVIKSVALDNHCFPHVSLRLSSKYRDVVSTIVFSQHRHRMRTPSEGRPPLPPPFCKASETATVFMLRIINFVHFELYLLFLRHRAAFTVFGKKTYAHVSG